MLDVLDLLGEISIMLDVLDLLPVTERLLERLDQQARRVGLNVNLGLPVLHRQPDSHSDALPGLRALHDVITDLLRRHTKRTNLGGQDRRRGDLATVLTDVDVLHLIGVELWCHGWKPKGRGNDATAILSLEPK